MTKIVEHDSFTGITETYYKEAGSSEIKIHKSGDMQPLFNQNALERNNASTGWKESFHKVASIQPIVLEMWREELKAAGYSDVNPLSKENKPWLIAKLNSRDFQKLRTKEGKL